MGTMNPGPICNRVGMGQASLDDILGDLPSLAQAAAGLETSLNVNYPSAASVSASNMLWPLVIGAVVLYLIVSKKSRS